MKKADLIKKTQEELADMLIELSKSSQDEIKKLKSDLESSDKNIKTLSDKNEQLMDYIAQQNEKITEQEKSIAAKVKVVKIGKANYKMPFSRVNYKGEILTVEQLIAIEALAKEVLEANLGILEEIKD